MEVSERLVTVAPLDLRWREQRAQVLLFSRSYERCAEEALRIVEIDPDFGLAYLRLSSAYWQMGKLDKGHRALLTYYEKCGTPCDWQREAHERGWANGGLEGSGRAWLAAATETPGYSPFRIGIEYGRVGETDRAFAWLERAYRERSTCLVSSS